MKETRGALVQDQSTSEAEGAIDSGLEEMGAGAGNESIAWDGSLVAGESFSGDELLDSEVGISTTEGLFVEMNKNRKRKPKKKSQIKKEDKKVEVEEGKRRNG